MSMFLARAAMIDRFCAFKRSIRSYFCETIKVFFFFAVVFFCVICLTELSVYFNSLMGFRVYNKKKCMTLTYNTNNLVEAICMGQGDEERLF